MTFAPLFVIDFDTTDADSFGLAKRKILTMLHALAGVNRMHLIAHPETPSLYESGVLYAPEDGSEQWLDIPNILRMGRVDCEDLACWRVAELRERGIRARPFIRWKRRTNYDFHVLVYRPDGELVDLPPRCPLGETYEVGDDGSIIEDPSLALGMGWLP
jgi:hypothetical protein